MFKMLQFYLGSGCLAIAAWAMYWGFVDHNGFMFACCGFNIGMAVSNFIMGTLNWKDFA